MLFLSECIGMTAGPGRGDTIGAELSPFIINELKFEVDLFCTTECGGVELPKVEFNVDDDLVVGTVPLDSLESFDESEVRKLARERLRSSLKKGMMTVVMNHVHIVVCTMLSGAWWIDEGPNDLASWSLICSFNESGADG